MQCVQCNRKYGPNHKSIIYVESNHKTKAHNCKFCEKVFPRSGSLNNHIKTQTIHEGQKIHKCDTCGKYFIQVETHYKCDFCGKSFTTSGNLKKHIKIIARKIISVRLKSHIKTIHDGRKDQNCSICSKSFSMKSYLKMHIKKVHERKYVP